MKGTHVHMTRISWLCLGVAFLLPAVDARGDTFPLSTAVPHSVPESLRPKLKSLAQQHADTLYNHLLLRTDEADRVCGLSDADKSVLELAAKGTVQHAIDDWLAPIAAEFASEPNGAIAQLLTMRISGQASARGVIEVRNLGNGRMIVRKEGNVVEVLQANDAQFRGEVMVFGGEFREFVGFAGQPATRPEAPPLDLDPADVSETGVWRATLDRLLTQQQRADLMVLRTRRQSLANDSQLEQMVKFIDEALLLDAPQRQRINELCVKFLLARSSNQDAVTLARIAMRTFSAEEMARLLSGRQHSRWRELTQQDDVPFDAYRPNVITNPGGGLRKGAGP